MALPHQQTFDDATKVIQVVLFSHQTHVSWSIWVIHKNSPTKMLMEGTLMRDSL